MEKSFHIQKKKIAVFVVLLVIFCDVLYSCNHKNPVHATRKDMYDVVYASGKIIAAGEHYIFAMSNGTVIKKLVNEEDAVKQGQPLFQIQNTSITSGLNIASDKVKLIQQFASPSKQDRYFIKSDCNGIAYKTMKEQGEAVHLNEPIILIGDAKGRIVELFVDQPDIGKIKTGQLVLLKTDITGDTIYKATISKIYSLMNEANQSFRIDAAFTTNFPRQFIHNDVEANIITNEKKNALVIPRTALVGNDSLWIEQNGRSKKIKVKTGISSFDYIEIQNGIDETTQIFIPK